MTRQPGHNSSSNGVFVVIKVTAGKSYNCNSESQPDTPCKLIPENADVLTKSSAPLSLPVQLTLGINGRIKAPSTHPPTHTHKHTLTVPCKCCPAWVFTASACHHNSQWQQTTGHATHHPWSLTEERWGGWAIAQRCVQTHYLPYLFTSLFQYFLTHYKVLLWCPAA